MDKFYFIEIIEILYIKFYVCEHLIMSTLMKKTNFYFIKFNLFSVQMNIL